MSQKRTFVLELKNDQAITLEFTPIDATGNRLWQMFATTEALDIVDQLVSQTAVTETSSARKTMPSAKSSTSKKKK
jgi:hypothetical protein